MLNVFKNLRGTTSSVFRIGKRGIDIFINPTGNGKHGDWCLLKNDVPQILSNKNGEWVDYGASHITEINSSSTYVPKKSGDVLLCDSTNELTVTIDTLPPRGSLMYIKDATGNATLNSILVSCSNGITIDGNSSIAINNDYTSITLLSTGTELHLI